MKATASRVGIVGTLGLGVLLLIAALLLMAAAPSQAHGQEPRLGKLPEPARSELNTLVTAANQRGLPTEALVDRALEGLAKGASAQAIIAAVGRLRDELVVAHRALGPGATGPEVTAGANAIRAGASGDELTRLKTLRADRSLVVAAGVFADLVASGVPADTAIGAVMALAADVADADYLAFRRTIQRDIAVGVSPMAAIDVRLRGLAEQGLTAGDTPGSVGGGTRVKRKP
ncbi:MAG: hypothetical protein FJ206_14740 [Gemmatimonadetes bacterium]|nr:hypothetical protein [Gemmatimonadota bacterium]